MGCVRASGVPGSRLAVVDIHMVDDSRRGVFVNSKLRAIATQKICKIKLLNISFHAPAAIYNNSRSTTATYIHHRWKTDFANGVLCAGFLADRFNCCILLTYPKNLQKKRILRSRESTLLLRYSLILGSTKSKLVLRILVCKPLTLFICKSFDLYVNVRVVETPRTHAYSTTNRFFGRFSVACRKFCVPSETSLAAHGNRRTCKCVSISIIVMIVWHLVPCTLWYTPSSLAPSGIHPLHSAYALTGKWKTACVRQHVLCNMVVLGFGPLIYVVSVIKKNIFPHHHSSHSPFVIKISNDTRLVLCTI